MKLKGDAIAFLDQPVFKGKSFPETADTSLIIVAVLAFGMLTGKHLTDIGRGIFKKVSMPVEIIQKKAQHNCLLPDVNAGEDLFTFDTHLRVNEHIFSPAESTADPTPKGVASECHFGIKCLDKRFIPGGDKIELVFFQQLIHGSVHCDLTIQSFSNGLIISKSNFG
jgi:hypothetical protein